MKRLRRFAFAVAVCVLLAGRAWSAQIIVDPNGSYDHTAIQAAIDDAGTTAGDTVIVRPGTYVENINMKGKAITLRSLEPADASIVAATIIDGGGAGSVIKCVSGEAINTVIRGFLITNGSGTQFGLPRFGGGMYNNLSSPTVTNCVFISNTASNGGAMFNNLSSPVVSNCYFCGNTPNNIAGAYVDAGGNSLYVACPDGDSDGVIDLFDNCVATANPAQADADGDGIGNVCDTCPNDADNDIDADGWCADVDNCPQIPNANQLDTDGDGVGDACDDSDNDTVFDDVDNCPDTPNAGQEDTDSDGIGNACDDDDDNDGIADAADNCPLTPNSDQADADGDGIGDVCDDVIYVNHDGPAPFANIQAAIDAAVSGDTIIVRAGRYIENIDLLGKAITLRSTDPTDPAVVTSTIIDGGAADSVITCKTGEDPNTVIRGFVITNGSGGTHGGLYRFGGGMYNRESSPTVSHCTFSSNTAVLGAGMYNNESSPTVNNCTFSGNAASDSGGGMWNVYSSPRVSNCVFTGNTADSDGGGMHNYRSFPTVSHCTFSGNTVANNGGGMSNKEGSSATVSNCTFSGNTAANRGGGMFNNISSPTVTDSYFCLNSPDAIDGPLHGNSAGNNFEFCPPPGPVEPELEGDVDGDGDVDFDDFAKMAANWLEGAE